VGHRAIHKARPHRRMPSEQQQQVFPQPSSCIVHQHKHVYLPFAEIDRAGHNVGEGYTLLTLTETGVGARRYPHRSPGIAIIRCMHVSLHAYKEKMHRIRFVIISMRMCAMVVRVSRARFPFWCESRRCARACKCICRNSFYRSGWGLRSRLRVLL
jgi:hypothetical protein